jgi:hypothetical protein
LELRSLTPLQRGAADARLLQELLEGGPYSENAAQEVVAFGTVLGDIIGETLGMSWVRFTDEDGTDLALRYAQTSIVVFPRSMILKRLERNEDPDLVYLFERVCEDVRRLVSEGRCK